jgi:uroporphyrinogen-III synthase
VSTVLSGRTIVVTRPAAQAGRLCRLITDSGGEAVAFPTVEILSIWKNIDRLACLKAANIINYDWLVFISPTAVAEGLAALAAGGTTPAHWPAAVAVAAVGRGTAAALERAGMKDVVAPATGADSEALAALPAMQAAAVAGRRVLIVRGEGGREWLADTLRERGATVEVAECYRRALPAVDAAPLASLLAAGGVAGITVHSRGALDNLLALLPAGAQAAVRATPLFASHPRIAEHARVSGLQQVTVAGPGDDEMIKGITAFFAKVAT